MSLVISVTLRYVQHYELHMSHVGQRCKMDTESNKSQIMSWCFFSLIWICCGSFIFPQRSHAVLDRRAIGLLGSAAAIATGRRRDLPVEECCVHWSPWRYSYINTWHKSSNTPCEMLRCVQTLGTWIQCVNRQNSFSLALSSWRCWVKDASVEEIDQEVRLQLWCSHDVLSFCVSF